MFVVLGAVALTWHVRSRLPVAHATMIDARNAIATTAPPNDPPSAALSATPPIEPILDSPAAPPVQPDTSVVHGNGTRRAHTATNTSRDERSDPEPTRPSPDACVRHCQGNVECALACVGTAEPQSAPIDDTAPVPTLPDRTAVQRALESRREAVSHCADGHHGWAIADVTFASSGRVTTALIRIPYAGTPAGSCVARAIRDARIPPFGSTSFLVTYSYPLL